MAELVDSIFIWVENLRRNVANAFSRMTPEKYIRLVAIIGAYALIRPYVMKLGSRFQTKEHEKEVDPTEMAAAAAISPNSLRGQVKVPEDSSDDEAEAQATGANWGKKARKLQRQMVKRILEAEENLRREQQEDDEDKDIEEFLVDS